MAKEQVLEIHSHSTMSDGKYSPQKMAELMKNAGVELWALTDHDTVAGCALAREAAKAQGVRFVAGIELSARDEGQSIHVLGYGVDVESEQISAYGEQAQQARQERMESMVERMTSLGFAITMKEVEGVAGAGNMGRPHMAQALVKKGYTDTIQSAFDRWLARGRPGYIPLTQLSVEGAIDLIVGAGGLVVLAHPARYGDISGRLGAWKERGLWGIEVRHPSHDLEAEERLLRWAERFGLGRTASNDWHGTHPEAMRRLGSVRFPEQWRRPFLEALKKD